MRTSHEIWLGDFEFQGQPGERPLPVCAVFREFHSGRTLRYWRDELLALKEAPIPTDDSTLFVAFYAVAELGCFLVLGWPLPARILDLYVEHRAESNGFTNGAGSGLIGALAWHGLDSMGADEKDDMRQLVLRGGPWAEEERAAILDYCQTDVDALARLLPCMVPGIVARGGGAPEQGLQRALWRGRYMAAVARMEHRGVPVDCALLSELRESWGWLVEAVVAEVAERFPVFDGTTFKRDRFATYLEACDIAWPRLESGALDLKDDTFKEMARSHPAEIGPIREVRTTLADLRLHKLAVGRDGRNRTMLSPFRARTGRNQPSNSEFIFGPATWVRSLIAPPPGRALAYVDYTAQEIAVAACLSGDAAMWADYQDDPYIGYGKRAGFLPADATRDSHGPDRERFKVVLLGIGYGMTDYGLAVRLGIGSEAARQLLRGHRKAYPAFWEWSDNVIAQGQLTGELCTVYGWPLHIGTDANPRSVRNFPVQANANEMFRLACIAVTEAGIDVCAPVHDALLVEADASEIDDVVGCMRYWMQRASEQVLGAGRVCRTDARIIRPGGRYSDPRGALMFDRVCNLLKDHSRKPSTELSNDLSTIHHSSLTERPNGEPINEPLGRLVT